jgi:ABC-type Zn2+ transport system substrate-binding protein/surface adhesin
LRRSKLSTKKFSAWKKKMKMKKKKKKKKEEEEEEEKKKKEKGKEKKKNKKKKIFCVLHVWYWRVIALRVSLWACARYLVK